MELKFESYLKELAQKYESEEFVKNDPVQIPRRYTDKINSEISGLITAWLMSGGTRKGVIIKADEVDDQILNGKPYNFVVETKGWERYKFSEDKLYCSYTYGDFYELCSRMYGIYTKFPSLEDAVIEQIKVGKDHPLEVLFANIEGISDYNLTKSSSYNLCTFVRWMCRQNSPVDLGIWTVFKSENLLCSIDKKALKSAKELGITTRSTADYFTAEEITDSFKSVFPDDPAKGDFVLYGFEIETKLKTKIDTVKALKSALKDNAPLVVSLNKEIAQLDEFDPLQTYNLVDYPEVAKNIDINKINVSEELKSMSVADILKVPLFFKNVQKEIIKIWGSRVRAQRNLQPNERLKAHPITHLHDAGLLDVGKFIVTFAKVLDKVSVKLSAAERDTVQALGMAAFNETMKQLIDNEANRDRDIR